MVIGGSNSLYICSIIFSIPLNAERRTTRAAVIIITPKREILLISVTMLRFPLDHKYLFAMYNDVLITSFSVTHQFSWHNPRNHQCEKPNLEFCGDFLNDFYFTPNFSLISSDIFQYHIFIWTSKNTQKTTC